MSMNKDDTNEDEEDEEDLKKQFLRLSVKDDGAGISEVRCLALLLLLSSHNKI